MTTYTSATPRNLAVFDNDPSRLAIRAAQEERPALNPICNNCILYGTNCDGTTNPVWTGCILKPWHPNPQTELFGVRSRHGARPAGLAEAAKLTRTASPERIISILYSETADAIKVHIRKPGQALVVPSTYQYITTAVTPISATDILKEIDHALDLAQELPF